MVIGLIFVVCEWYFILKKHQFNFCKITYALKLIQILFTTFESLTNRILRQEQCQAWLSNPIHGLKRDSSDIERSRPLTMVFYCAFERVLENKEKKETAETIHYYRWNKILTNVLVISEVLYCLFCMGLFLLVIYWSHQKQNLVVLGKDQYYDTDSDEEKQKESAVYLNEFEQKRGNLFSKYKQDDRKNPKEYSYMKDSLSFPQFKENEINLSQNAFIK